MTTRHLGKRLYPLVDGRLARAETIEAMTHVDDCVACRSAWDNLRRDREALQTSGKGIDMKFAVRLLDQGRIAEIALAEPKRHVKVASRVRPHVWRASITGAVLCVTVLGILWSLGAPDEVRLDSVLAGDAIPGQQTAVVSNSAIRGSDALATWALPAWDDEEIIPVEALLIDHAGSATLFVTIRSDGSEITMTETTGRLPRNIAESMDLWAGAPRALFVIEDPHQILAFEAADKVVVLACRCAPEVLVDVALAFPEAYGPTVFERLGDGAQAVADAVTGG